jgi:hypothetical protein
LADEETAGLKPSGDEFVFGPGSHSSQRECPAVR